MDILSFLVSDETQKKNLDWRQQPEVKLAQATHREVMLKHTEATRTRLQTWAWRTADEEALRLKHHIEWASADLAHRGSELALHEIQSTLLKVEATAKASVREAWEQLFKKAFASVEQIATGELSDRLRELGQLWDEANGLGIGLPVALTSVTLSPQGLSEWSQAVRKELGS